MREAIRSVTAVSSFAAKASLKTGLGRRGGAGFHGVSVVIDHAALSGLDACYFSLSLYTCHKHSAATKHCFIAFF